MTGPELMYWFLLVHDPFYLWDGKKFILRDDVR